MLNSSLICEENSNQLEKILLELNILKTDRILFIGSKNLSLCLYLCSNGYEKLYLIDKQKDVYNNPCYTNIRYFYQKDFILHFPLRFFKVILVSKSDFNEGLFEYAQGDGAIIASNFNINGDLSTDNVSFNPLSPNASKGTIFNTRMTSQANSSFQIFKVDAKEAGNLLPKRIDIICYSGKEDGIYVHSKILKQRLETEYGMLVNLNDNARSVQSSLVVIEYHPGYGHFDKLFEDIVMLLNEKTKVILENHGSLRKSSESLSRLINKGLIVTYRSPEIAEHDNIERYSILPVLTYKNINVQRSVKTEEIRIGTFGFIGKQKGIEDIISLAFKLKIHAELILGVNPIDPDAERKIADFKRKYGKRKNMSINIYKKRVSYFEDVLVNVFIGNHTDNDIIDAMSKCSHIVFAHRTRMEESGTIKYAKRLSKPIFALDSYQARIGQVTRFSKFTNLTPLRIFKDTVIRNLLEITRGEGDFITFLLESIRNFIINIKLLLHSTRPTLRELRNIDNKRVMDDDGLEYLYSMLKAL